MKRKIFVALLGMALAVGILSGCVEQVANEIPVASFTYAPMEGIYPDIQITFTDVSTDEDGTVDAWSWDFGDTVGTSTDQNPTYTYTATGTYIVTLIVTDDDGNTSEAATVTIEVTNVPPMASFNYTPMINITTQDEIIFEDTSTAGDANITAWAWDFGVDENSTSTDQNPTYTYAAAGDYTVSLTVTDANDMEDTATVDITII